MKLKPAASGSSGNSAIRADSRFVPQPHTSAAALPATRSLFGNAAGNRTIGTSGIGSSLIGASDHRLSEMTRSPDGPITRSSLLPAGRQGIVAIFGVHAHALRTGLHIAPWSMHLHFDVAIAGSNRRSRAIANDVLIARLLGNLRVRRFDGLGVELVESLSAGRRREFRQDVCWAELGDGNTLQGAIAGQRRPAHAHCVHGEIVREQHLEDITVTGCATFLSAI